VTTHGATLMRIVGLQCEKENINGVFSDGGHAEYALLRTEAVAKLPEDIDPVKAAPLL
jgi:D-arabinose 1-dehydrogenase-like Zn-dependent alcohol dehydrogenase